MGSTYRIKDDRITQINRKMPHVAFTINVEDSALTQDEKYLTTRYTVYYYSPKDGSLANRGEFHGFSRQGWKRGPACDPAALFPMKKGATVTRTITFENHKPL